MWIICLKILLPPTGFLCDSGCNDTVLSCLCINVLNLLFHLSDFFHLLSLSNTLFFFFGFTISFPKPAEGIFTEFSHLCCLGLLGRGSRVRSARGLNSTRLFLTSLEAESPRTRLPQTCVWWRSFLVLSVSSHGGRGCGLQCLSVLPGAEGRGRTEGFSRVCVFSVAVGSKVILRPKWIRWCSCFSLDVQGRSYYIKKTNEERYGRVEMRQSRGEDWFPLGRVSTAVHEKGAYGDNEHKRTLSENR